MATIKRFEDLEAWKKARLLALEVWKVSNQKGFARDYKLKDQVNAACGSTMDNIAEGFGRGSRMEYIHFLSIAKGSNEEVKSQLYRAMDKAYLTRVISADFMQLRMKLGKQYTE